MLSRKICQSLCSKGIFFLTKKYLSINISPMKKRSKKSNRFSLTEVGALIEAMRAEFKPILEDIPSIRSKLDSTYEQVGKNTEGIEHLRLLVTKNTEEIKENRRLINRILEELKPKVDRKDFELLEKKVASLAR